MAGSKQGGIAVEDRSETHDKAALPTLTEDLERASQSDIPLNGLSSRNARFYEHRTKKVPLVEMNHSLARQELTVPPSFAQSQFETIIRRQRNSPHGLKIIDIPPRFPNLDNEWEFAVCFIAQSADSLIIYHTQRDGGQYDTLISKNQT
jgi:hypothetical protein